MNYILMGVGLALFGAGAMRQFGTKKEQQAAEAVIKTVAPEVKKDATPGINVTANPANA